MRIFHSLVLFGALAFPAFPQAAVQPPLPTLVLIELAGGLDGLSAVVPYADPAYAAARPTLAVPADQVVKLDAGLGLHPALAPLADSWKAGDMAIVLGVGYPDPNLSHFRSIAIWETASASNQVLETGWLARLFAAGPGWPDLVADGIVLGETHPGPLKGPQMKNLSFDNLDAFIRDAGSIEDPGPQPGAAGSIAKVQHDVAEAAVALAKIRPQVREPSSPFPETPLGRSMKLTFQLLDAGVRVPVVKLTLRGFDTHSNQKADLDRLLKDLATSVAAFRTNLKADGLWDRVVVATYSEFGRRVGENGSRGTDHGTAAPLFLWGGRVHGGLVGHQPSLTDLDQGNLKMGIDFRTVFRSLAGQLWALPDAQLDAAFPLTKDSLALLNP
jgi:uncharacterized protein (DUF1501 family)